MNIFITGTKGFVGSKLLEHYPNAICSPSLRTITEEELRRVLDQAQPDVIIHTAAVSDMGDCEKDPVGSYHANVILPQMIARCNPGAKLIVFSSDQVYNGCTEPGPYREADLCAANVYGREKVEMEQRVLDLDPNAVMLRAEWMYDYGYPRNNYINIMCNAEGPVECSSTEYRGVTYIREVCENMDAVMKLPGGAYNFGSETTLPMMEVNRAFLAMTGKNNPLVDRPGGKNLWMDCSKARAYGVDFSPILGGIERCLRDHKLI